MRIQPPAETAAVRTTATTRGLLVVFAPHELAAAHLSQVLDVTSARIIEFTGSVDARRWTG